MSMQRFRAILNRLPQDKVVKIGLQFLAEELILEILRYLHWPTDFYNVSVVSRTLNRLATHELYSILVVGYHRPERISALLSHLRMRPELSSLVKTLVFDEDIKCIGPKLQDPEKWPPRVHRRELADNWDPKNPDLLSSTSYPHNRHHEAISYQLNVVLSGLPNIRRIIMRSVHPLYMHLGFPGKKPNIAETETFPAYTGLNSDCNVWACVSVRSPFITELFVNGVTKEMPPKTMLLSLTTLCISDLYYGINSHVRQACMWNIVLKHTINLQTLGMIRVEYAYVVLAGRVFPHLEALELYKVFLGEPQEANTQILSRFLQQHSSTLRTLALSTHLWWSVNHCVWLSDGNILPKLQTLRLDNIFALLGTVTEPATQGDDSALDVSARITDIIISFIAHRPTILDVRISSLATSQADKFAQYLAETRPMRNILIGSTVIQSLNSHTSIAQRYWDYSYEAWTFYQLFEGLTITRSGFRPRLPSQTWKFWKKTSS